MSAQPAQGRAPGITPSKTVTISLVGGVLKPSIDPVPILAGGSVEFINGTTQDILLELFTTRNDHKVDVSVYVAAGANAVLCNDPTDANRNCFYNIMAYPSHASPNDNPSGGHTIQIGSGNEGQGNG